jgi:hypothetical protein
MSEQENTVALSIASNVTKYEYPRIYRSFSTIFSAVWVTVIILILYGGIHVTNDIFAMTTIVQSPFLWQELAILWFIIIGLSTICLLPLALSITMFPGISVRDDGFRIHNRTSTSRWLEWQAMHKALKGPLGMFWLLGIRGLGPLYWPPGLLWWLGSGGVQVSPQIGKYNELMKLLREKRPDLFI